MASLPGAEQVNKLKLPLILLLLQGAFLAAARLLRASLPGAEDECKLKPLRLPLLLQLLALLSESQA